MKLVASWRPLESPAADAERIHVLRSALVLNSAPHLALMWKIVELSQVL